MSLATQLKLTHSIVKIDVMKGKSETKPVTLTEKALVQDTFILNQSNRYFGDTRFTQILST